jgi:hypothetical protein
MTSKKDDISESEPALKTPDTTTIVDPSGCGFLRGTVLMQEDIVSPDFEPWGETGDTR